ncbi:hypothetical protein [Algoriphagus chordae]|uniref:Uncharacterized protein n=1 Tax=Algoriphagus chordae TaxID=237019 RepID=A0A2W7RPY9_9BACT|nr:hypothetical protein [Algoriphagus chordae]PZX56569.1 hypothetical protein LV85_00496 [Algoriphagus chordae]
MKKLNSLIYLFYYLLLWVVLPSTGLGERVFASEFGDRDYYTVTKSDTNFSDFHHCVNPDWNRISRQGSNDDWLSNTGHWPVLFSSIFKPQFRISEGEILNISFLSTPVYGALTAAKIIFPFHYFW